MKPRGLLANLFLTSGRPTRRYLSGVNAPLQLSGVNAKMQGGRGEKQEQFLFNDLAGDEFPHPSPKSCAVNGSKYLLLKVQVKRRKEVNCRSHLLGSFSPQGQQRCLLNVPCLISRSDDSSKVFCCRDTFMLSRLPVSAGVPPAAR